MSAKTLNERQKAFRRRQQAAGQKEVRNLWAHPDDHPAIKALALSLAAKRVKSTRAP
jgi:hypothetical protein